MLTSQLLDYQLLDFGDGRKLERFGRYLLDRASPAAENSSCNDRQLWRKADAFIDTHGKEIVSQSIDLTNWQVNIAGLSFQLKLTPFGHLGVFPEQQINWLWLQSLTERTPRESPRQALNLFAYTGGSTLALAKAGFAITHVDASAPAIRWARDNAQLNQLHEHPIRWIVEDARTFVARELKRQRKYDCIVMDPPSFGHGPTGKPWEIVRDLPPLLEKCRELLTENSHFLFTAHSVEPAPKEIEGWLKSKLWQAKLAEPVSTARLTLVDARGRELDSGFYIRA